MRTLWAELQVILQASPSDTDDLRVHIGKFCLLATNAMWRELIIGIVAFNDYPEEQGKKCASLHALSKVPTQNDRKGLCDALLSVNKELGHLTTVRANHIGHYQRKAQLERTKTKVEQEHVSRGLDMIEEVLLQFEILHSLPAPPRIHGPVDEGGSKSLLKLLRETTHGSSQFKETVQRGTTSKWRSHCKDWLTLLRRRSGSANV
ncbi:MAG: hypothetical protein IPN85_03325 [Flavobacteriales bacterium]|nr:hypothetical protein [Flavobacteriales bacterium]MBL0036294.1 hypothetical protein [Flavobacteriales bacterium]